MQIKIFNRLLKFAKYRHKTELLPLSLIMILIHKNVDSKQNCSPLEQSIKLQIVKMYTCSSFE